MIGLSQPDYYENHKETFSWKKTMFDHAYLVAAIAMFNAFIVDIRNAESATVYFYSIKLSQTLF